MNFTVKSLLQKIQLFLNYEQPKISHLLGKELTRKLLMLPVHTLGKDALLTTLKSLLNCVHRHLMIVRFQRVNEEPGQGALFWRQ